MTSDWTYLSTWERYRISDGNYHFSWHVLGQWWEWHRPIVRPERLPDMSCVVIY